MREAEEMRDDEEPIVLEEIAGATRFNTYSRLGSPDRDELDQFRSFYLEALEQVGGEWRLSEDFYNEERGMGVVEFDFTLTLAQAFEWPVTFESTDIAGSLQVEYEELDRLPHNSIVRRVDELRAEHWERKVKDAPPEAFARTLGRASDVGMLGEVHLERIRSDAEGRLPVTALAPLLAHRSRRLRIFAQTLISAAQAGPGTREATDTPEVQDTRDARGRSR